MKLNEAVSKRLLELLDEKRFVKGIFTIKHA